MRLAWQVTTSQHSWQKQTYKTASQQQHQEHQHWRQQQMIKNKHFQQKNAHSTEEQPENYNGYISYATKELQEHFNNQQQPTSRSWNTFWNTSKEQLHSPASALRPNCMPSTLEQWKRFTSEVSWWNFSTSTKSTARFTQTHQVARAWPQELDLQGRQNRLSSNMMSHDFVRLIKTHTNDNPADILTKYVSTETLQRHLQQAGPATQPSLKQQSNSFTSCSLQRASSNISIYCRARAHQNIQFHTHTHLNHGINNSWSTSLL